jgi:hypothetical protein
MVMVGTIHELDVIELLDGREVAVLEVYPNGNYLCEDSEVNENEELDLCDAIIDVRSDQVKQVLWRSNET